MGKPKFSRKKYETPSHPWEEERIKAENELIKKYGLKNKREIWKAQTRLRNYRGQARELFARITSDAESKKESDQLLMHLNKMNILPKNATLDDVLALKTESILSRRLQTITYLKGLANTPDQARQLISHGHISIGNRRVTIPSYMVTQDEEGEIGYMPDSPLNDTMHPARPKADYQKRPIKKEIELKELKKVEKSEKIPKPEEKPIEKKSTEPTTDIKDTKIEQAEEKTKDKKVQIEEKTTSDIEQKTEEKVKDKKEEKQKISDIKKLEEKKEVTNTSTENDAKKGDK